MHIVLYHHAVIPPKKYGGTERIVYWLGKALLELGHEITLVSRAGSKLEGARLIEADDQGEWERKLPADVDLIHLWATPHQPPQKPFIVTIQGNGRPGERFLPNTVFISKKHAANHGSDVFVHNGIDVEEYPCDARRDDSLVFLAKASWKVKNLAGAVELAREAGLLLKVMGSRDLPLRLQRFLPAYRGIRYLGMVDDIEKRKHLRKARALLFPVRWHEPFGIAITEAMASGCAVFGTPYGSLPEIISPEAGHLSAHASELLEAIRKKTYDPLACRNRVLQGFTHLNMANSYLALYQKLLNGMSLSASEAPRSNFQSSAETLLPYQFLSERVRA